MGTYNDIHEQADTPITKRKSRKECIQLKGILHIGLVDKIYKWPLGNRVINTDKSNGMTDCVLYLVDAVRLGGRYNCRRVRYDGDFYIRHHGLNHYLVGFELVERVFNVVDWVYHVESRVYGKMHSERIVTECMYTVG